MESEYISILSLDSTTAGSLLSPDDEDLAWSKEVIEEVEKNTCGGACKKGVEFGLVASSLSAGQW